MLKIKTIQKEFNIEDVWSSYIFSYVIIFLIKKDLFDNEIEYITIENKLLPDFYTSISKSLIDLLDVYYSEPLDKEYQKHPTRFEKICIENRVFKVNYRMSVIGRMAYFIY